MARDRMFHVLVLGGIALVGAPPSCGGDTTNPSDAGTQRDGFPTEGPNVEAGVKDAVQEFPSELPVYVEAATDVAEEFPREGPAPPPDQ